jgi:hypothetical protein
VPNYTCPPSTLPLRCSWADGAAITGLNYTATDLSEGVFGDGWTRYIDAIGGQWYLIFLDNWYLTGAGFTLTWNLQNGAIISCSLLPVELLDLKATAVGQDVHLDWLTGSEQGSDHFMIERSKDGVDFTPIGRLAAAGNSTMPVAYRFVDEQPFTGTNFYRLLQVDLDGSSTLSPVVTAVRGSGVPALAISPNPVVDALGLTFEANEEGAYTWSIVDNSGRLVLQGQVSVMQGMNKVSIPLPTIDPGSYVLQLVAARNATVQSVRFVKE